MRNEVSSPILDKIDPGERTSLLQRSVRRAAGPGDVLYLAGSQEPRVFLVQRGVVKHSGRDSEGRETLLGLSFAGDLFGDSALLEGVPQPLDAVAASPLQVLSLDGEAFLRALLRSPRAAVALSSSLAERYRWMCEATLERAGAEVPARLAGRLLALAQVLGRVQPEGIEMELPLDQTDLARLAGMCRESACKTLRRFKDDGLLDYRGRRLRILRPDVLERIRCAGRAAAPFR